MRLRRREEQEEKRRIGNCIFTPRDQIHSGTHVHKSC